MKKNKTEICQFCRKCNDLLWSVLYSVARTCTHLTNIAENYLALWPYPDYFLNFISVTSLLHIFFFLQLSYIFLLPHLTHCPYFFPPHVLACIQKFSFTSELHIIENKADMRLLPDFLRPTLTFMKKKRMKNLWLQLKLNPHSSFNAVLRYYDMHRENTTNSQQHKSS